MLANERPLGGHPSSQALCDTLLMEKQEGDRTWARAEATAGPQVPGHGGTCSEAGDTKGGFTRLQGPLGMFVPHTPHRLTLEAWMGLPGQTMARVGGRFQRNRKTSKLTRKTGLAFQLFPGGR